MKYLFFLQLLHILNDVFLASYVFLFPKKFDLYFMIYSVLIKIHWLFLQDECILSVIEKKLENKNYVIGSEPYRQPYQDLLPSFMHTLFPILKFINVFLIAQRNQKQPIILVLATLSILLSFHQGYKKYVSNNNNNNKKNKN
jgi:hypothetical protein